MDQINIHALLNYWRGLYKILEEDWQHSAQQLGLTPAEEHLLWIIHFEKEINISDIAKIGLWELSTAMQIVNRAKTKGLIHVKKKERDKRITFVTLTEKGIKISLGVISPRLDYKSYSLISFFVLSIQSTKSFP